MTTTETHTFITTDEVPETLAADCQLAHYGAFSYGRKVAEFLVKIDGRIYAACAHCAESLRSTTPVMSYDAIRHARNPQPLTPEAQAIVDIAKAVGAGLLTEAEGMEQARQAALAWKAAQ